MPRRDKPYEVLYDMGRMYCCKPGDDTWHPALFHDQVRQQLIILAEGPNKSSYSKSNGLRVDMSANP